MEHLTQPETGPGREHQGHAPPRVGRSFLSENQRSLCMAALIVLTLGAGMAYLAGKTAPPPQLTFRVEQPRAERSPSPTNPAAESRIAVPRSRSGREQFAALLDRRFRARGRGLSALATGTEAQVFQLRWPAGKADTAHMNQLQRAESLWREAQSRGFLRVEQREGERIVWFRDLR